MWAIAAVSSTQVLQDPDGIIAASDSVDQLSSFSDDLTLALLWKTDSTVTRQTTFHNREIFEILRPLTIEGNRLGIIRIGLSMDEVRAIERQSLRRNIMRSVILFFVALLTITALIANQNFRISRQRIQAMETFTGNILERMQDAVITIDADQKISIFNKQAEKLFGIDASHVLDRLFSEIARERFSCLKEIFFSDVSNKEISLVCPDKSERTVSIAITRSEKNTTAVIRDLTETKRLQQEIERREKLSAMGELAAGVAHEIRNPLNAISMIAQRYEKEFKPAHGIKEYTMITSVLLKEARRVNNIIQQFLRFARPPKLKIEPTLVSDFLSHTEALFKSGAKAKGVDFSLASNCEGMLNIDQEQMTQALLNILQNALEATPKGGNIQLQCAKSDSAVHIDVIDSGQGIPKNQLQKIFNLYYTTKPNGTGLGLAITQQIIQQHNGSIRVESEEGKGTRFRLTLPIAD